MLRFKELRIVKNQTQQQISDLLGITRGAYTNIENGKREADYKTIEFLSNYYDVSVDFLLGMSTKEKPTIQKDDGLQGLLQDPMNLEFYKIFSSLSQDQKEKILSDMHWLKRQREAQK